MSLPPATVRVTQDHINRGEPWSACRCPVALAIREQGRYSEHAVHVDHTEVLLRPNLMAALPPAAVRFTWDFDVSRPVGPIEFGLDWQEVTEP